MKLELVGAELELLPERALFWKSESCLILSDVHLGKAAALQSQGVPIPETRGGDLDRLAGLVRRYRPHEVFILGDFIHHRRSWTPLLDRELTAFFEDFHGVDWRLVLGNHERGSVEYLRKYPMELVEEDVAFGPVIMSHGHTARAEGRFYIEGHVHPIVTIREGSTRLRLPCFWLSADALVLPSFGETTGGFEPERADGDRIFAVTPETVFEVPALPRRFRGR